MADFPRIGFSLLGLLLLVEGARLAGPDVQAAGVAVRGQLNALGWTAPSAPQQPAPTPPAKPAQAPGASSSVLLRDDLSDPAAGRLPKTSADPAFYDRGYAGGEYFLRKLDPERAGVIIAPLPGTYTNAKLEVDAHVVGETALRYVALQCRRPTSVNSGYRLTVRPDSGQASLVRWDGDQEAAVFARREYPAARRENSLNHLALTCAGGTITGSVNGVTVASVTDTVYTTGQMWIGAGALSGSHTPSEARFSRLLLSRA